ncbi:MAG: hypothetical protein H7644_10000, partial [Candidatus Heimdallarchaeota archaeon]|nr:hypothetical protein [Candidatus Heimdallarchaeota archaeon]MCK5144087.1 hypothetical protein [Candidatus Heimdallarchaeota archaeon]
NNEIVCEAKGDYILTIVKEKGTYESLVSRVKKNFQDNFQPLEIIKESTPWIEDEELLEKEREGIYYFMRNLNLIINRRTINSQKKKTVLIEVEDDLEKPLLIQDVDMLITLESGQPVFLMLTLSLPYDATLITAFMSAVLDLGKSIGLGELKILESENLIIYVQKIEKAFAVVISHKKENRAIYRRFAEFVADLCNDWLYNEGIEIDEAFQIFEEKKHFEEIIKILIDTDTWEKHLIKEWERDYAEQLRIEN